MLRTSNCVSRDPCVCQPKFSRSPPVKPYVFRSVKVQRPHYIFSPVVKVLRPGIVMNLKFTNVLLTFTPLVKLSSKSYAFFPSVLFTSILTSHLFRLDFYLPWTWRWGWSHYCLSPFYTMFMSMPIHWKYRQDSIMPLISVIFKCFFEELSLSLELYDYEGCIVSLVRDM